MGFGIQFNRGFLETTQTRDGDVKQDFKYKMVATVNNGDQVADENRTRT